MVARDGATRKDLKETMLKDRNDYVTREEAADLLGICLDTVSNWTRKGILIATTFPQEESGRPLTYYLRAHVLQVSVAREEKSPTVLALQSLATATTLERRLTEIYEALGLGVEPLARDSGSVRQPYEESNQPLLLRRLRDASWLRHWASLVFGMDTYYFALTDAVLEKEDTWLHYVNFLDLVELHAQDVSPVEGRSSSLVAAYRYLSAAKKHLMYQGFVHCVQKYSLPVTIEGLRRGRDLVNELCSIIS